MSNQRPPVIFVTKYGNAIGERELQDQGFLQYMIEREAEKAFESSHSQQSGAASGEVASDPSFYKDLKRRNTVMQAFKSTA